MEIVMKDIFFKLMFDTLKIDITLTIIYPAKINRAFKFNQEASLKQYIDMNTELRKSTKTHFGKYFFELGINAVFGKTIENVRKHSDVKLVTTEAKRNYLVSEPNNHTIKDFPDNLLATGMRRTQILMNEPVYLGLSIF